MSHVFFGNNDNFHCCFCFCHFEPLRYSLGHVFDKDYTGQDRSKPYVDQIAIPRQLVPQYAKDGVLQISIELDVQVSLIFLQLSKRDFCVSDLELQRLPETIQWPVGSAGTVSLPGLLNDVCCTSKKFATFCLGAGFSVLFAGCLHASQRFSFLRPVLNSANNLVSLNKMQEAEDKT
jgi:hypothetical protein